MDSSVPLLTFTNYSEWKMKMIASLKRQGLYDVSIGLSEESFESENDWMNECDAAFGNLQLSLSRSMRYLSRTVKYPKDLWTKLDRIFGMFDEDHNSTLETTSSTISIIDPKIYASTLSDEFVQDEEEAKSSSSDSPLNFVPNLPVIASESEEEFDLSPSNFSTGENM